MAKRFSSRNENVANYLIAEFQRFDDKTGNQQGVKYYKFGRKMIFLISAVGMTLGVFIQSIFPIERTL